MKKKCEASRVQAYFKNQRFMLETVRHRLLEIIPFKEAQTNLNTFNELYYLN